MADKKKKDDEIIDEPSAKVKDKEKDKEKGKDDEGQDGKKEKKVLALSSPMVKILIMAIVFLILLSATVGIAVYMIKNLTPKNWDTTTEPGKNPEEKIQIQEKKQDALPTHKVEEPFKMILYDKDGNAYSMSLKIAFGIKPEKQEEMHAELEARFSEIKDIILQTLYSQNPAELIYPNGQIALRIEIKNRVNQVMVRPVERVFFEDFVISR